MSSQHCVFLWHDANAQLYWWPVNTGSSHTEGGRSLHCPPTSVLLVLLRLPTPSNTGGWQLCHPGQGECSTHQLLPLLGWMLGSWAVACDLMRRPKGQPRCCISNPWRLPGEHLVCWLYSVMLVWQQYLGPYITRILNLFGVEGALFHFSCLIAEDEKPFRLQVVKTLTGLGLKE